VTSFLDWLVETPLAVFMQTFPLAFALVEVVHVIAVVLVFGMIAVVDLRLLGLAGRSRPYAALAKESLRWVWGAFVVAVASGLMMFISQAPVYMQNGHFLTKMVFIALAGINMLVMEFVTSKNSGEWPAAAGGIPGAARVAGALSLGFWTMVVVQGRWIGFTMFSMPSF